MPEGKPIVILHKDERNTYKIRMLHFPINFCIFKLIINFIWHLLHELLCFVWFFFVISVVAFFLYMIVRMHACKNVEQKLSFYIFEYI